MYYFLLIAGIAFTLALAWLIRSVFQGGISKKRAQMKDPTALVIAKAESKAARLSKKDPKKSMIQTTPKSDQNHKLLLNSLRGHADIITGLAISGDGRVVISCSRDRTFKVWAAWLPTPLYKSVVSKFEFATACCLSTEGVYAGIALSETRSLELYGISMMDGKEDQMTVHLLHKFSSNHSDDVASMIFSPDNSFILTVARGQDTTVRGWTPKGEPLFATATKQVINHSLDIACDGRYFAVATHMPDVKIWELQNDDDKVISAGENPTNADVIMCLKGYLKGVNHLAFGAPDAKGEARLMATACADGSWRLWDLTVRYTQGEDSKEHELILGCVPKVHLHRKRKTSPRQFAQCVGTVNVKHHGGEVGENGGGVVSIAMTKNPAPQMQLVAVAVHNGDLIIYQADKNNSITVLDTIENPHRGGITALMFSKCGQQLISTGLDRTIKMWKIPKVLPSAAAVNVQNLISAAVTAGDQGKDGKDGKDAKVGKIEKERSSVSSVSGDESNKVKQKFKKLKSKH